MPSMKDRDDDHRYGPNRLPSIDGPLFRLFPGTAAVWFGTLIVVGALHVLRVHETLLVATLMAIITILCFSTTRPG